jgi:hypothetical protein
VTLVGRVVGGAEGLDERDRLNVVTEILDRLVRTLRLAAQRQQTFNVLYCKGWFEERDHFGIVYSLPLNYSWSVPM